RTTPTSKLRRGRLTTGRWWQSWRCSARYRKNNFFPELSISTTLNAFHMAKYSEKAGEKVEKSGRELKDGKLKSGSGKKVTSRKQGVAIGLSEARKAGAKVPKKKKKG